MAIGSHARPFRTDSRWLRAARWEVGSPPRRGVRSVSPHATPTWSALYATAARELQSGRPAFSRWRLSCGRPTTLVPSLLLYHKASRAIPYVSIGTLVLLGCPRLGSAH